MPNVCCPRTGKDSQNCVWSFRGGRVRDAQEVGVKECTQCFMVSHSKDISNLVDYPDGSMHQWTGGYGQSDLLGPRGDVVRRIKELSKLKEQQGFTTLLDFGCGSGDMLKNLSSQFTVFGLEPDVGAREKASKYGTIWESSRAALDSGRKFDIITLFHVVEHFYDPIQELRDIVELLNPGGIVVIETPNARDALLTKFENEAFQNFTYWSHHPILHSKESMEALMISLGLEAYLSGGCQRYGLANHLYWLSKNEPGGHSKWEDLCSAETSELYAKDLVSKGIQDTLWFIGRKSKKI